MRSEYQRAKDRAWKAFSKYIRTRDCLKTTHTKEQGVCITCGQVKEFKSLQAGHLVGGRGNAVLFDEEIVNAQCGGCNIQYNERAKVVYRRVMVVRHGEERVKEMESLLWRTKTFNIPDLDALTDYFKEKLCDL